MINWVNLAFALGTGVPMGLWVSKNLFDTEYKIKKATTKGLKYLFEERNIINKSGVYPFIKKIEVHSWGVKALIDIKKVCSFEEFQKIKDNINTYFGSLKVDVIDRRGKVEINIINIPVEEGEFLNYRYVPLSPYQLLLGYGDDKELLITDMKSRPHVLITGLSEQGKTGMVKCITTNLIPNADVVVCNSFRDDFAKIKGVIKSSFACSSTNFCNFSIFAPFTPLAKSKALKTSPSSMQAAIKASSSLTTSIFLAVLANDNMRSRLLLFKILSCIFSKSISLT